MRTTAAYESVVIAVGSESVAARVWAPDDAGAVVVLHSATATPQRFYEAFATHLATAGFAVVTYDYSGTGLSGPPKQHPSRSMRRWIAEDVPSVTAWARDRFLRLPSVAVGHSVGGHAIALGGAGDALDAAVLFASHAGVTRTIPDRRERLRVGLLMNVLTPLLTPLVGYLPGRRVGLGEDVPTEMMREWARWTRKPGYFFDDPTMHAAERAGRVTGPVLAIGASDDPWATPQQIDAITSRLTGADVERRTVIPGAIGAARIGHHGLLRRGIGEPVWDDVAAWIREQIGTV